MRQKGSCGRRPSNHLVYQGSRVVVVSQRGGSELRIEVAADHPQIERYLEFLGAMLTRQFAPRRSLTVESINDQPALESPYATILERLFDTTREPSGLKLRRRF